MHQRSKPSVRVPGREILERLDVLDARLDALNARLDALDKRRQIRRARLDGVEYSGQGARLSGDDR
jgi:outer membrane protein TolC